MRAQCTHVDQVTEVTPRTPQGCRERLATGGRAGCTSDYASPAVTWDAVPPPPSRHATKHFHSAGHPIVRSFEPGKSWVWCYADQAEVDLDA